MPTPEAIRERLFQRRRTLLSRYRDELERVEEELANRASEDAELAAEQWDARILSTLGNADVRAITAVVGALDRLKAGTYGRCVSCGEAIALPRLQAVPEAATCLECAKAVSS